MLSEVETSAFFCVSVTKREEKADPSTPLRSAQDDGFTPFIYGSTSPSESPNYMSKRRKYRLPRLNECKN